MAKFPVYERSQGISGSARMPYMDSNALTGPARALVGLGGAIGDLGSEVAQIHAKFADDRRNADSAKRTADFQVELDQADAEARKTSDGVNFTADAHKRFEQIAEKYAAGAPDDEGKRRFMAFAESQRPAFMRSAGLFQAGTEIAKINSDLTAGLNGQLTRIRQSPDNYDSAFTQGSAAIEALKDRLTPEQELKLRDWFKSSAQFERAKGIKDKDPQAAMRDMGGGQRGGPTAWRDAIASIESAGSGGYSAVGPTHPKLGRALGRYQIMEANIPSWSRAALGREVTVAEFMAKPAIQDAIFDHKFGGYVRRFGEEGAAQAWFAGPGGVGKTDRKDVLGTDVGGYGAKFMAALGRKGGPNTEGNPYYDALTPDQISQLYEQSDTEVTKQVAQDYASMKDQFALMMANNQVTRSDIEASSLNAGDKAAFLTKWDKDHAGEARGMEINRAISEGRSVGLNIFDADDKKAGDAGYDLRIKGASMEALPTISEDYVRATGYVPKALQQALRQGALASDARQMAYAMQLADRVENAAPGAFGKFDGSSEVSDKLARFRSLTFGRGMNAEQAAAEMVKPEDGTSKASRDVLKTQATAFTKDLTVNDVAAAFDPGWFGFEPDVGLGGRNAVLLADYRRLAEDAFYENGGDKNAAKGLAISRLRKTWGVSAVSGSPTITKYPPENFYPTIGGTHDYLAAGAREAADAYAAEQGHTVLDIGILADERTIREKDSGIPPTYRLFYTYNDAESGQTLVDEVLTNRFGLTSEQLKARVEADKSRAGERFIEAWSDADQELEHDAQVEADARRAYDETTGEDWMKAKAEQAVRERGRMRNVETSDGSSM